MRLTKEEIEIIKQVFLELFESGEIYLFGSRVDDSKRGGDIDLFIKTDNKEKILDKKISFLSLLKQKIGDQKIDVIVSTDITRTIEQEALHKGIKL
jgi:predicted nucleotidyltransferase